MFSAIDMACKYIEGKKIKNVIVVSCDTITRDSSRVQPHGLFSDASSACLISSEHAGYKIISYADGTDIKGLIKDDDFESRAKLARDVMSNVLSKTGVQVSDLKKVFSTNFFSPIVLFNASAISLKNDQLYAATTSKYGHCICSDPIINLIDYDEYN